MYGLGHLLGVLQYAPCAWGGGLLYNMELWWRLHFPTQSKSQGERFKYFIIKVVFL